MVKTRFETSSYYKYLQIFDSIFILFIVYVAFKFYFVGSQVDIDGSDKPAYWFGSFLYSIQYVVLLAKIVSYLLYLKISFKNEYCIKCGTNYLVNLSQSMQFKIYQSTFNQKITSEVMLRYKFLQYHACVIKGLIATKT